MMELDEFISETPTSIVKGIRAAQTGDELGPYIAPDRIGGHTFPPESGVFYSSRILSTVVKFDVAVTTETKGTSGGKGSFKIAVMGVGVGADMGKETEATNTSVSRIAFAVPVMLPKNPGSWSEPDTIKVPAV